MRFIFQISVFFLATALAISPARADLVPLGNLDLSKKTDVFIVGRCAGFYIAMLSVLDVKQFPKSFIEQTSSKAKALLSALVIMRQDSLGVAAEEIKQSALNEATLYSLDYQDVFNRYFRETGEQFDNTLFRSDSQICETLVTENYT